MRLQSHTCAKRKGAAAVELAVMLPMIMFLLLAATDFARIFYYSITVTNCARNGALYSCDPTVQGTSPFKSAEEAALSDATNMTGATCYSKTVTDGTNTFSEVTVHYTFHTIARYPGIPDTIALSRTVRMRNIATVPNFN